MYCMYHHHYNFTPPVCSLSTIAITLWHRWDTNFQGRNKQGSFCKRAEKEEHFVGQYMQVNRRVRWQGSLGLEGERERIIPPVSFSHKGLIFCTGFHCSVEVRIFTDYEQERWHFFGLEEMALEVPSRP